MALTLLTKLEAVNEILSVVGVAPVASLGADEEATEAERALDEANREIQGTGWWFNTEHEVELTPAAGEITLATNVLAVDIPKRGPRATTYKDYTFRDGKIYDLTEKTFTITEASLKATVVYGLDFDEIPQVAREYAMKLAARRFQERTQGSGLHARYTREDLLMGKAKLMKLHCRFGEYKLLSDYDGWRTLRKGRRFN